MQSHCLTNVLPRGPLSVCATVQGEVCGAIRSCSLNYALSCSRTRATKTFKKFWGLKRPTHYSYMLNRNHRSSPKTNGYGVLTGGASVPKCHSRAHIRLPRMKGMDACILNPLPTSRTSALKIQFYLEFVIFNMARTKVCPILLFIKVCHSLVFCL